MSLIISVNETIIRLSFFFGILLLIATWEAFLPRRALTQKKWIRWYSNLGIVALNTILLRSLFATSAVGFAFLAKEHSWGIFNNSNLSSALAILLSVVFLDLAIYLQHVMFHAVPILWRLHRMHHADLDYDVTTGVRFHPIEIILSMVIKLAVISILGAPSISVIIFEVLLNATAMFNHGNIYLPLKIDRFLRWFLVTPDMHRIHHSIHIDETHSNFGFNLPCWDRLLGTYRKEPKDKQETMTIGIDLFREEKYLNLHWLLIQPFLKGKNKCNINEDKAA